MMSWMKQPQQRQSRRRIAELLLVTVDFVELDGLKKMTWLGYYGRLISPSNAMQCSVLCAMLSIFMTKKKRRGGGRADRRKSGLLNRAAGLPSFSPAVGFSDLLALLLQNSEDRTKISTQPSNNNNNSVYK